MAEANGGQVNDAQVLALRKEYLPGGVKQAIKSTPAAELASKTRAGEISELQAEVDLAAKRLALTGLTLERDGQRYVIAARNVAQQEYENRLLEIKNSWIGKVFDKEKNLAMIRAANLKLANDIKGIEYEIAQNQEQQYSAALQVDSQRAQEALRTMDLNEQIARTQDGELAALYNTIMLMEKRTDRQQEILQNEYDIAMVEARRNGTQAAVDALYTARLENLKKEADLNKMIAQQKLAQLKIEQEMDRTRRQNSFFDEEQGVLGMSPKERTALEEDLYRIDEQQKSLLSPKLDRVQELRDLLAAPAGVFNTEQITLYRQELTDLEGNIIRLSNGFNKVREDTKVFDQQRQLIELANGAAGLFASSLGSAFDAAVSSSEKLGEALRNITADLLAAIGKMLIFYAIGASLKALAGGKNDDKGGILTYLAKGFGFAEGGFVTGPTNAIIGEGGESEYVIPASKMSSAMANYNAGKRGSSVIEDSSGAGTSSGGGSNTFTLETVVINQVEYATVAQVREMGKVAANQGAQGGYTKTLSSMRNSRATRARLGMG